MPISFDRAFSLHDDALILRGQRSSILASNIANADTPHYKARDIDFSAMLREANGAGQSRLSLAATDRDHISAAQGISPAALKYRVPLHGSLDGNSVDAHVEQAEFAQNALLYQTSFRFLNGKIQGIVKALKGE